MSLVVGTNSWTTVSEADTYLTNKINAADWFDNTLIPETDDPGEISKESLLVSAYNWLFSAPELSLPVSTTTDENVKKAQIEAAWFLYKHDDALDERRAAIYTGVTSFKLSKRSENLDINNLIIPSYIMGYLRGYGVQNTTALLLGEYDE